MTHPNQAKTIGRPRLMRPAGVVLAATGAAIVLSSCLSLSGPAGGSWGRGDHSPAVLHERQDPAPGHTPTAGSNSPGAVVPTVSNDHNADPASATKDREPGSAPNAVVSDQDLADLIYRIVEATERNDPRLTLFDRQIERIDREMDHIRTSEGWEFVISDRNVDVDADRREKRGGTTRRLDGTFRKAHDFFGDLDDKEDEFVLKLQRSFGEPDHERFVDGALKRMEKMDKIAAKQEIRRELHLETIDSILQILYCRSVDPLIEKKIDLARRRLELIEKARKAEEAPKRDVLTARRHLHLAEEERTLGGFDWKSALKELRRKTGDPGLNLPTTFPLAADTDPPPATCEEEAVTSYSLAGRLDYHIAWLRLKLADKLKWHMAWHLPKIDFEVWWTRFSEHRRYLDEFRKDRGRAFSTELSISFPLNLPAHSWARHKMFSAAREAIAMDLEQIRAMIAEDVLRTYLDWRRAYLSRSLALDAIEEAREGERAVALMVRLTPEEIEGIPTVKLIDAQIEVLDARIDLLKAEKALLLAQAHWDYLRGDSPIDRAVAPFAARERREAEKTSWLKWWMSLIK